MSSALLALASILHVAAASPAAALPTAGGDAGLRARCGCPAAAPLDESRIRAGIDELMRAEGLPPAPVLVGIRPVELDDDLQTREALVDLVAPTLCLSGGCPTLVVQQTANGAIGTVGRGVALYPTASRTRGWVDLTNNAIWTSERRVMHFTGLRYR